MRKILSSLLGREVRNIDAKDRWTLAVFLPAREKWRAICLLHAAEHTDWMKIDNNKQLTVAKRVDEKKLFVGWEVGRIRTGTD